MARNGTIVYFYHMLTLEPRRVGTGTNLATKLLLLVPGLSAFEQIQAFQSSLVLPMSHHWYNEWYNEWIDKVEIGVHDM